MVGRAAPNSRAQRLSGYGQARRPIVRARGCQRRSYGCESLNRAFQGHDTARECVDILMAHLVFACRVARAFRRLRGIERGVGSFGGALTHRRNFIDAAGQRGEVVGERFGLCRELGNTVAERRVAALGCELALDLVEPRGQIRGDVLRGGG